MSQAFRQLDLRGYDEYKLQNDMDEDARLEQLSNRHVRITPLRPYEPTTFIRFDSKAEPDIDF